MSRYTPVQSLSRGLCVLRALNAMEGGRATSMQLAEVTGLHRTTVRRLLETLIGEGMVRRSVSDDSFRLTLNVRTLSEGFTDDEQIATVAPPIMAQLLQRIAWPSDLATPNGDAMLIRETTHRFSRLSFHRSMVGVRLPMLLTASGRVYLSTCTDAERENILEGLRAGAGGAQQQALALDRVFIRNLVEQTCNAGFGTNHGDWIDQGKIGSVAVAIASAGRVFGSLNVVYLKQHTPPAEAARRYVPALQWAAHEIQISMLSINRVAPIFAATSATSEPSGASDDGADKSARRRIDT